MESQFNMKSSFILNLFYWSIFASFSFSLFVERYSVAAFFALLVIVIQLSEIATYLADVLVHIKAKQEDFDSKK
jgi:hypothetical protein